MKNKAIRMARFGILLFSSWSGHLMAHDENSVEVQRISAAIEASPDDAALYLERAEMHRLTGHWHLAEKDYQQAQIIEPDLKLLDLAFGTMLIQASRPAEAIPVLDRFLANHPESVEGHVERAMARRDLKQWPEAVADYAQAAKLAKSPGPDLFMDWADVLIMSGDTKAALDAMALGLQRVGDHPSLQHKALDIERKMGLHEKALERLVLMLALPGRKDSLLLLKANLLCEAGHPLDALPVLELAKVEMASLPDSRRFTPASLELAEQIDALMIQIQNKNNTASQRE